MIVIKTESFECDNKLSVPVPLVTIKLLMECQNNENLKDSLRVIVDHDSDFLGFVKGTESPKLPMTPEFTEKVILKLCPELISTEADISVFMKNSLESTESFRK